MTLRAIIVDDEPLARQRLHLLARDVAGLEIITECANGKDALAALAKHTPDLLFLDVQMPGMDGFELIETMPRNRLPIVIFTTAFDHHAVRAFETHALDYLLKPIRPDRFQAAVARACEHLTNRQASAAARGLLDFLAARQPEPANMPTPDAAHFLTRLTIKTNDIVVVIKTADIDTIESAGNYVAVHVGKENHILRETLSALEAQLDPMKFLRVSRSAIVNLDRVKELQPMFKGEHVLVLHTGKRLAMTRGLREVEQALRFG